MKRVPPPAFQPPASTAATHTFIIRIWQDRDGRTVSQPVWRGLVEQVGSDRHVYFFDFESLGRFIQEQTGIPIKKGRRALSALFKWMHHAE